MRLNGLPASLLSGAKAPVAALLSALLLSACVEGAATMGTAAPEQPAIVTDDTIYAARSDGQYTIPGLPVEQIPETYRRQTVAYETDQPAGTIIIDPSKRLLYYVLGNGQAIRYGIAVGAEGFGWSGESIVANKRHWPTWTPPKEMIARKPELAKWENGQPGGPTNPLGARAIYLTSGGVDYGYRIHGTPEWKSIGRNASSGCFRMINQDVMDLFERVQGGEKVIVLTASGEMPKGLTIPKPPAPKKTAAPAPTPAPIVPAPELTLMGPPPALGGVPAALAPATPEPAAAEPAVAPATPEATTTEAADNAPVVTAEPPAPICAVPLVDGACPAN